MAVKQKSERKRSKIMNEIKINEEKRVFLLIFSSKPYFLIIFGFMRRFFEQKYSKGPHLTVMRICTHQPQELDLAKFKSSLNHTLDQMLLLKLSFRLWWYSAQV